MSKLRSKIKDKGLKERQIHVRFFKNKYIGCMKCYIKLTSLGELKMQKNIPICTFLLE